MTMRRCRITSLGFALALASCGADEGSQGSRPGEPLPPGAPLEVGEEPVLAVGEVEGDTLRQLDFVTTPFLHPDGRLFIPLTRARTIRVFGPDGSFATSLGGPGEGPGEFSDLAVAWTRGDAVEVHDFALHRVTRFPPEGGPEVIALDPVDVGLGPIHGPLGDGWVMSGVANIGPDRPPRSRDETAVFRFSADGSLGPEIARVPGLARYTGANGAMRVEPMSPRALIRVHRGEVYVAETLEPRIRVFGGEGALQREITWEAGLPADPRAALDAVVDSAVARAGAGEGPATRRRLEGAPLPERLSVFWDFVVDEEGFLWIREYEPLRHALELGWRRTAGGGPWLVLSPEGVPVGEVTLPDGLSPVQITTDAVVGIRRDELDVEYVEVHPLRRR